MTTNLRKPAPNTGATTAATEHTQSASSEQEGPGALATAMTVLLDGDQADLRWRVRKLLATPAFRRTSGGDLTQQRRRTLAWTLRLAEEGFGSLAYPRAVGGQDNIAAYLAVFETLAHHDLSLLIKFGVQFGLFGGSIQHLGTEYHHRRYLAEIAAMRVMGAFAMTETGHGSNVRDLETTAHYNAATEEFVIHTPHPSARKDYIGNAACDGRLATVFAQLIVNGAPHGVHAFVTPIRDAQGNPAPGVTIEDVGEKMGLNGVDNGRLSFDHVRVPRHALLDRFAQVTPTGVYQSTIENESKRFFTMLGTLVGGRVAIGMAALSAAKSALTIAVRYALRRRQFGQPGGAETLLLDYPTHQRRLLIPLARTYALSFASAYLVDRFTHRTEADVREIEALAASFKAYSTWQATRTIQECREACGAQGYLAENRLAALKADSDIFTTFEGDNTVLMQLVAKSLLTDFQHCLHDLNAFDMMRFATAQATHAVRDRTSSVRTATEPEHLLSASFQLEAFRHREQALLTSLAQRIKQLQTRQRDPHAILLQTQTHLMALAQAFIERVVLERFIAVINKVDNPALCLLLARLCSLYALATIEEHKGWYLEHGYFDGVKTKAIRRQVDALCAAVRIDAGALVDAFAIPDEVLAAPIGVR